MNLLKAANETLLSENNIWSCSEVSFSDMRYLSFISLFSCTSVILEKGISPSQYTAAPWWLVLLKLFIVVFHYFITCHMYPLITLITTNCIVIFSNSLFANATRIFYMHFKLLKNVVFVSCQSKFRINRLTTEYEKGLIWIEQVGCCCSCKVILIG